MPFKSKYNIMCTNVHTKILQLFLPTNYSEHSHIRNYFTITNNLQFDWVTTTKFFIAFYKIIIHLKILRMGIKLRNKTYNYFGGNQFMRVRLG